MMKRRTVNPTDEFYQQLLLAYEHFNHELFAGALPGCLISIQREKRTMGFFSPLRWIHSEGAQAHEIALNPIYFAKRKLIDLFQTLVHEQCHLWQHEFGKPSRPGYHNKEWAEKMESLGLIPSDTGRPGGKMTGQKMSDFPSDEGIFKKACVDLVSTGFKLSWVDRGYTRVHDMRTEIPRQDHYSSAAEVTLLSTVGGYFKNLDQWPSVKPEYSKKKVKYCCAGCETNVWGKPNLILRCEQCDLLFKTEAGDAILST